MGFMMEEKAQAEAVDVLLMALLISFSSFLIATYGLGSYRADMPMITLQRRYLEDFCQSFILTAEYVSVENLNYTIGAQGDFSKLSEVIETGTGVNPLKRNVNGRIFDLIAQDLYFSLAFHHNNRSFPLNNWFLTSRFHGEVERLVTKEFNFLSGGNFNYRIEASYHPFKGIEEDRVFYSELVYTNGNIPKESDVYVTSFYIPTLTYNEAQNFILIENFSENLDNSLLDVLPSEINISGYPIRFSQVVKEVNSALKVAGRNPPLREYAEIKMMVWLKAEG